MHRTNTILIFLIFAICLLSCESKKSIELLTDIDSYIQERPDSALTILTSFNKEALKSKKDRARYSLLYATALDKCYIDTTDLDVILPAVSYYADHGSPADKMKAYYYQGRIYFNRGENNLAMQNYMLALEDSSKVKDVKYKELSNSAISDIFSNDHNYEQELVYARAALAYGRTIKDSVGIWVLSGNIASCLGNLRRWEEAMPAYNSLFSMPVFDSLYYYRHRLFYAKDLLRKLEPDPKQSISIIEDVMTRKPEVMTIDAYCVYAYAQQLVGETSVANSLISQLESMNKQPETVRVWRYRIYREQGHYQEAIADLEQSVLTQDSIVVATLSQSSVQAQRDYQRARARILKQNNEIERQRAMLILALSLFALTMVTGIFIKKRTTFKKQMEGLSAHYQESQKMIDLQNEEKAEMNCLLEQKDSSLISLRKQFANIYKAQYKALNDLCAAYLSPIKKDRKDLLYEEAMRQVHDIVSDTEKQQLFMAKVNDSLDGIMNKLRIDLPKHKEQDFVFLMYIIIGLDATTISSLTGYSIGTVYTKKNRLKKEISALDSVNRDFYLFYLD